MFSAPFLAAGGITDPALITFSFYLLAVFFLAWKSSRVQKGKGFVNEYFLGNRGFGMWAFALTFAATAASGGTFMGFPSLIYLHGWVLALWIAGYMVVPIVGMAVMGKRLNEIARKANAVTVPEVLQKRLKSPTAGLVATLLIVFFMFFYLLAQFKGGSEILSKLLGEIDIFKNASQGMGQVLQATSFGPFQNADPLYVLCLLVFGISVIVYVVYGGFRAVVWTDVMQGVIMFIGVLVMLALVLYQTGGLEKATRTLAKMTPPVPGTATVQLPVGSESSDLPQGAWFKLSGAANENQWVKLTEPGKATASGAAASPIAVLQYRHVDGVTAPIETTLPQGAQVTIADKGSYAYGRDTEGVYVSAPGPHKDKGLGFLSVTLAISFFFFWPFGTLAQPSNMVRLMAFKDTPTLRKAIVTVTIYFTVVYFFLVVIFCCGKTLLPGMEHTSDRIMPELVSLLTSNAGVPWLAGILLAAPFAAVMSSVDSFLLMVSSSIVRDIYQNRMNPDAEERVLKRLSYIVTAVVGLAAMIAVINPPTLLQDLIVFASGGLAGCFLIPVMLMLFWKRMNGAGAIAGMIGGFTMHTSLLVGGIILNDGAFKVLEPFDIAPLIWDLLVSALCAIGACLIARTPKPELVDEFFYEEK
jgi:sodium/pantothenate symporter